MSRLYDCCNCQHELKETARRSGPGKTAVSPWSEQLRAEVEVWVGVLAQEEGLRQLKRSDMDSVVDLIDVLSESTAAASQSGLSADRIAGVLRSFYGSLFAMTTSSFERLVDPETREDTRVRTARVVAEAYAKVKRTVSLDRQGLLGGIDVTDDYCNGSLCRQVYDLVSSPRHGYDVSVLTHTVEEVRLLLGCA